MTFVCVPTKSYAIQVGFETSILGDKELSVSASDENLRFLYRAGRYKAKFLCRKVFQVFLSN